MLGATSVSSDEGKVDLRLHRCRELNFRALGCIPQALQSHFVALGTQVESFILLEFINQPVHQPLVYVVAAEVRVAIRSFNFNYAVTDFEDRNIERSAPEVVDGNGLVFLFIEAISECGGRRLIDNSLYIEAGNSSAVFCGLP